MREALDMMEEEWGISCTVFVARAAGTCVPCYKYEVITIALRSLGGAVDRVLIVISRQGTPSLKTQWRHLVDNI
jgi:hypothetical protein